jgi:hypothetical protein
MIGTPEVGVATTAAANCSSAQNSPFSATKPPVHGFAVITSLDGTWSEQLEIDQSGNIPSLAALAIAACRCR